jgi:hypothetical protein
MMKKVLLKQGRYLIPLVIIYLFTSCNEAEGPLAPYIGSPPLSQITIEGGSFTPKITWVGGYATVMGINRGSNAALDTSLVWLIHNPGNTLRYPVQYGSLPEGASDLTSMYGGQTEPELIEDRNYTFWIMKEEAWQEVSNSVNKIIRADSVSQNISVNGDTISIPISYHAQLNKNFDNYINIFEITTRGLLADIQVEQTDTSNGVVISWTIKQAGYTDSTVAAVGIAEGNQYDINLVVWEIYSEDIVEGQPVYGKSNAITSPIYPTEERPGTRIFFPFPLNGLNRNTSYYVWVAGKDWNGVDRLRSTPDYAFLTFRTR